MGRPSRLTPEATERFVQAIGAGVPPETAARYAGFSPASYYRYVKGTTPAHAAFREAALRAQTTLEVLLAGTLTRAALRDPKWALTLLERRFSEHWARRQQADPAPAQGAAPSSADEMVVLDAALVEILVPRLLEAGARPPARHSAVETVVARFEDRAPRRVGPDVEGRT
jgi:hypothetical protein